MSIWRLLRLALLALFILLLQSPPRQVEPGPQQQVVTTLPILGVHTRLTDEVEPWKIQHSLQRVREMGAPWIVELFSWALMEPQPGVYDWAHADLVVAHARAQGLTIIARLSLVPGWARPPDTPLNLLQPTAFADYADFAAAFAARYAGEISHLIVLNEPNLSFEWGGQMGSAADYSRLLAAVYPAVKRVNPDLVLLAGALAPTIEPPGSPNGLNDLLYLRQMYEAGAAAHFDALAVHAYGLTEPPAAPPAPDRLNFRRVELLRALMLEFGDERPIYITESGYNDHPRWVHAVSPAQRISYTEAMLRYTVDHWPYVEAVIIWQFRTPTWTRSHRDYHTLLTPDFVQKPIYEALRRLTGNAD